MELASSLFAPNRYSAKRMSKPVNFVCFAPLAKLVCLVGDFNSWNAESTPMVRQPDGAWLVQVLLHHGHHQYRFLVDGKQVLDSKASGVARDGNGERASLIAVS
jgi:1,4-alpha-glucan branching enzyme